MGVDEGIIQVIDGCRNYLGKLSKRYLLFLIFSVLVANPEKLLYTVANPARGLLNRGNMTKRESLASHPSHPPPTRCSFGENIVKIT